MNRSFITLHNIFPWKVTVFQLSSRFYANALSSLNPSFEESSCGFPLVFPAVSHPKHNGSCCSQSSWPCTAPTKIYTRARTTRWITNIMKSWVGEPKERGRDYCKQLTGEQSTTPADDPLLPIAVTGWGTAFSQLTQPWLAPRYLLVTKRSRTIRCFYLLHWKENTFGRPIALVPFFHDEMPGLTSHTC